jgi:hypothetical protein
MIEEQVTSCAAPVSSIFSLDIMGTSSVMLQESEDQPFSNESRYESSSSSVLRIDEEQDINRITSRIDAGKVNNIALKDKLDSFLAVFKQFLLKVPSEIRRRLPMLSMVQDADGDLIVNWATRKANAIFDLAASWKDSFWCATCGGEGEQKSESANLTENTLLEGISKSYYLLLPYV